jgi:phage shock protein C
MQYDASRRLTRSSRERMLTGVAGGMAEYFDLDPVVVRLIWVGAVIVTGGLAIPAYLVMWMVMPRDDGTPTIRPFGRRSRVGEPVGVTATTTADPATEADLDPSADPSVNPSADPSAETIFESTVPPPRDYGMPPPPSEAPPFVRDPARREQRQRTAGIILIALGILFLAGQSGIFWWIEWRYMWPLVLIAIGVGILVRQGTGRR